MIEKNTLYHYLSPSGIRLTIADATEACMEAQRIHTLAPRSAIPLGKALTTAALLATDFKNHEGVTLKWILPGGEGTIHADAYEGHFVRGYIDYPAQDIIENTGKIEEKGHLFVTRYSLLKQPYTSAVDLHTEDMAGGLTEYLDTSEQIPSKVSLEMYTDETGKITAAGGYMVQLMPGGDRDAFMKCSVPDHPWSVFDEEKQPVSQLIKQEEFMILSGGPLSFRCTCSEERIHSSLMMLPSQDRESLLTDDAIEIVCHYCGKTYEISQAVLKKWFDEERGSVLQ